MRVHVPAATLAAAVAATLVLLAVVVLWAVPAGAATASRRTSTLTSASSATNPENPVPVALSTVPPAGHRLSSDEVLAIADRLAKMRAVRHAYRGSFGDVYLKGGFQWQVSYFDKSGKKEIGLVVIDDL